MDADSVSEGGGSLAGRDSKRRLPSSPSRSGRVTAVAIERRALRAQLDARAAALSQLVSATDWAGSSSSSSDSDGDSSSGDEAAGAAPPDPAALLRELEETRRLVRAQGRVLLTQQALLRVSGPSSVPLHADLAPFAAPTARRLPLLSSSSRAALEKSLPPVDDFPAWRDPEPALRTLAKSAGVSLSRFATQEGPRFARRALRVAEATAGLYALMADPSPPADEDVRSGLAAIFRLSLAIAADLDVAVRSDALRSVSADPVPPALIANRDEDAVVADEDLHMLLAEREMVERLAPLARPRGSRGSGRQRTASARAGGGGGGSGGGGGGSSSGHPSRGGGGGSGGQRLSSSAKRRNRRKLLAAGSAAGAPQGPGRSASAAGAPDVFKEMLSSLAQQAAPRGRSRSRGPPPSAQ